MKKSDDQFLLVLVAGIIMAMCLLAAGLAIIDAILNGWK